MTPSRVSRPHTKRSDAPDRTDRNLDVLEIMPLFRPAVYQESQLFEAKPRPVLAEATRHAEIERRRRKEDRMLFEELSRYYRLRPFSVERSG